MLPPKAATTPLVDADPSTGSVRERMKVSLTKKSTLYVIKGKDVNHVVKGKTALDTHLSNRKGGVQQRGLDRCITAAGKLCLLICMIFSVYRTCLSFLGQSGLLHNENRLAEIESLSNATKMMQVQVEVIDQKVEGQLGSSSVEVIGELEKRSVLAGRYKKLEDDQESLGRKLKEMEFLLARLQQDDVKAIEGHLGSFREDLTSQNIQKLEDNRESLEKKLKEMEFLLTQLQFEVDAIYRKIECQLGSFREENAGEVEEQRTVLAGHNIKKLEDEGKSLELKSKACLSREEFSQNLFDLIIERNPEIDSQRLNWDDIWPLARDILMEESNKRAAYGLKKVDYASVAAGGKVIRHSLPYYRAKLHTLLVFLGLGEVDTRAARILQRGREHPRCFALNGSCGFFEIKLRTAIIPEAITLEHLTKIEGYDWYAAPKEFKVSGWMHGSQNAKIVFLGEFVFDLERSSAKTFDLYPCTGANCMVDVIQLDIMSNHGNPFYTCIDRVRVHGSRLDSIVRNITSP